MLKVKTSIHKHFTYIGTYDFKYFHKLQKIIKYKCKHVKQKY